MPFISMFSRSVLAGAFIALGAIFSTTITAGTSGTWPFGVTRLLAGLVFCLGLILVEVGGAELFFCARSTTDKILRGRCRFTTRRLELGCFSAK